MDSHVQALMPPHTITVLVEKGRIKYMCSVEFSSDIMRGLVYIGHITTAAHDVPIRHT